MILCTELSIGTTSSLWTELSIGPTPSLWTDVSIAPTNDNMVGSVFAAKS